MTQQDILYKRAFDSVGWVSGLSALPEVVRAEHDLNEMWLLVNDGKKSMKDFKITLNTWEDTCKNAKRKLG